MLTLSDFFENVVNKIAYVEFEFRRHNYSTRSSSSSTLSGRMCILHIAQRLQRIRSYLNKVDRHPICFRQVISSGVGTRAAGI